MVFNRCSRLFRFGNHLLDINCDGALTGNPCAAQQAAKDNIATAKAGKGSVADSAKAALGIK